MPRRRLGVALLVSPPFDHEVDALRRACDDGSLGRIPPHLTLVPPVNVPAGGVDDAVAVLRAAARQVGPLRVGLGPPATFLPDTPVLHLPVTAGGDDVQRLRDLVFVPPLARKLTWPFVPHVTLADELAADRIEAALVAMAGYRLDVTFDRVHLLEEGAGRVWEPIADVALAEPAIVGRGGLSLELAAAERPAPDVVAFVERERGLLGHTTRRPFVVSARRAGELVGVALGWSEGDTAHLDELLVDAASRREGIGSRLVEAVERLAAERGCTRVSAGVPGGSRAEAFLLGRGWQLGGGEGRTQLVRPLTH